MYRALVLIRSHDAGTDETQWRRFVTDQGFGQLAVNADPVPVVVPTQFALGEAEVILHLAAANPVFAALDANPNAVLSVAGDWAYIPGAWKAIGDENPALGVPTTYYAAVQLIGTVTVFDGPQDIADILRTQLADVEPDGGLVDPSEHERRFPAIRGLRLSIDEVRSKFKFGGNADDAHRAAVSERLGERNGPGDAAAAAHVPRDRD